MYGDQLRLVAVSHGAEATKRGHRWSRFTGMTDKAIQPEAQSGLLTRRLVGIKEVAGYIGLSVHTVYAMVSQRRIPYVKVGRLTKFDLAMVNAWIKQNTVMPMPQRRPCG